MFHENLITMRRLRQMTQETLAEQVGVSRQALAKWESGETMPDIGKAKLLAEALDVSLDALISHEAAQAGLPVPPRGKHIFGVVKVGDKGQIVIPQKARKIFSISPGDSLIVLGDEAQGLALLKERDFLRMVEAVRAHTTP